MNKLYQRINWQNYPSDSTPLNESNLNKMDAAVDGIDDRVVTLDVTKLPVATANTMVKDVTFNESTGVFTITKLNGTQVTVNTALEKIATNFRYDYSTQKLILTLIDGTTQEVDLSALLTQYEFLNSSTIQFTIDSSGKVKASVVNGSITGDMLEPNYLANVTLQASKADTSAKNAKESEEKAAEYAESAKNSADSAEPVASTATGTNPTIQDSTNAPLIYGKFKGYTLQNGEPTPDNPVEINGLAKDGAIEVTTTGKNIFGGLALAQALVDSGSTNVVLDENAKTIQYGRKTDGSYTLFDKFKENTQYTIMLNGNHSNNSNATYTTNLFVSYTDGTAKGIDLNNTGEFNHLFVTQVNKSVSAIYYSNGDIDTTTLNYEQCGIFEGVITAEEFELYTETTANIPTDAPLYEGDYLEVYADGSGKLVRDKYEYTVTSDVIEMGYQNNYVDIVLPLVGIGSGNYVVEENMHSTHFTGGTRDGVYYGREKQKAAINSTGARILASIEGYTTLAEYEAFFDSEECKFVYKLAEPTETPLTAEQVEQFKKLYSFEPVTNVLCDGEVEIRYYKANVNGETVGIVHKKTETSEKAIEDMQTEFGQLPDTFAKKSLYDDTTINVGRKEGSTVGGYSTAEGRINTASGYTSHAEGVSNISSGDSAHAEGSGTTASGDSAHAEGMGTKAIGLYSHVEGNGTIAHGNSQHVQGEYNVEDTEGKYAHIVGGGTYAERKNIHTLDWDGNAEFSGNIIAHDASGNEISLRKIAEDFKWKIAGSVSGKNPISLSGLDFKEIKVVTLLKTTSGYEEIYTTIIIREEMSETDRYWCEGWHYINGTVCQWCGSTNFIQTTTMITGNVDYLTNYPDSIYTTVYYR